MRSVVTTTAGKVCGARTGEGNHRFLGVPYAAPPLGALRFREPEPVEPWTGVRDATDPGPTAPQPAHGFTLIPEPVKPGKDFLNLNIVTPELGAARLPVLVWIHGGGFVSGCNASPWYRGDRFARDGVVVVSVNYRLGTEGFMVLDGAPSNRGVLDWLFALQWVRDNIAAFGGDPSRVTVAGQSAGGAACATLLTAKQAEGLFGRAILMSGAAEMVIPSEAARRLAERFAAELGIAPARQDFAGITPEELIEVQQRLAGLSSAGPIDPVAIARRFSRGVLDFGPTVDGVVLEAVPLEKVVAGRGSDVSVLVGNTSEEFDMMGAAVGDVTDDQVIATFAALGLSDEQASHYRSELGYRPPGSMLGHLFTDRTFRVPSARLAEARMTAQAATFLYEFGWRSPAMGGMLGAAHCLDLPFVFDCLDAPGVEDVLGTEPPQSLADTMHRAWVDFVRSGDPGWPAYGDSRRSAMVFDCEPRVIDDAARTLRTVWEVTP